MKPNIHPKYYPNATVICATCGTTWQTGSTQEVIHTDMCSNCHPFYTGTQRLVDTEGQVDRFMKRLEARDQARAEAEARDAARSSPDQPVAGLELGSRTENALKGAGLETVAQILERFEQGGDEALLAIDGFGRKSLADLKRRLRSRGLMPDEAEVETAPEAETA
jgi:large subunit ribosomal protein L31